MAGPSPAPRYDSPPRSRFLAGCAVVSVTAVVVGWLLLGPQQPREQAPPQSALSSSEASLEAAQQALDAWGRFAVTGDLEELDGHFHPDGPQHAQLRNEAPAVRARADGGPPYEFQIEDATVEVYDSRHTRLRADVTLTRPSEAARSYKWRLELAPGPDGGWKLWTVSDQ